MTFLISSQELCSLEIFRSVLYISASGSPVIETTRNTRCELYSLSIQSFRLVKTHTRTHIRSSLWRRQTQMIISFLNLCFKTVHCISSYSCSRISSRSISKARIPSQLRPVQIHVDGNPFGDI